MVSNFGLLLFLARQVSVLGLFCIPALKTKICQLNHSGRLNVFQYCGLRSGHLVPRHQKLQSNWLSAVWVLKLGFWHQAHFSLFLLRPIAQKSEMYVRLLVATLFDSCWILFTTSSCGRSNNSSPLPLELLGNPETSASKGLVLIVMFCYRLKTVPWTHSQESRSVLYSKKTFNGLNWTSDMLIRPLLLLRSNLQSQFTRSRLACIHR